MHIDKKTVLLALLWIGLLNAVWAQVTPGFNTKIPEQIMTPDNLSDQFRHLSFYRRKEIVSVPYCDLAAAHFIASVMCCLPNGVSNERISCPSSV